MGSLLWRSGTAENTQCTTYYKRTRRISSTRLSSTTGTHGVNKEWRLAKKRCFTMASSLWHSGTQTRRISSTRLSSSTGTHGVHKELCLAKKQLFTWGSFLCHSSTERKHAMHEVSQIDCYKVETDACHQAQERTEWIKKGVLQRQILHNWDPPIMQRHRKKTRNARSLTTKAIQISHSRLSSNTGTHGVNKERRLASKLKSQWDRSYDTAAKKEHMQRTAYYKHTITISNTCLSSNTGTIP